MKNVLAAALAFAAVALLWAIILWRKEAAMLAENLPPAEVDVVTTIAAGFCASGATLGGYYLRLLRRGR